MSRYVEKKWRPPLILILGGSLMAILILPIYGAVFADLLTPMTGRRNAVYIVAVFAFIATLVLGWLLWRLILGPVQALRQGRAYPRGWSADAAGALRHTRNR